MDESMSAEASDLGTHYGKVVFIGDYARAAGGLRGDPNAPALAISEVLRDLVMIDGSLRRGELRLYPVV